MIRVLVAGILGGVIVFGCGFVEHMVFEWGGRSFSRLPSVSAMVDFMKWALADGQKEAPALNYAPLPKEVVDRETQALGKIQL